MCDTKLESIRAEWHRQGDKYIYIYMYFHRSIPPVQCGVVDQRAMKYIIYDRWGWQVVWSSTLARTCSHYVFYILVYSALVVPSVLGNCTIFRTTIQIKIKPFQSDLNTGPLIIIINDRKTDSAPHAINMIVSVSSLLFFFGLLVTELRVVANSIIFLRGFTKAKMSIENPRKTLPIVDTYT